MSTSTQPSVSVASQSTTTFLSTSLAGIVPYRIWDIDSGAIVLKPENVKLDLLSKSGMNQKLVRYNKMIEDLNNPSEAYAKYYDDVANNANAISTTMVADYEDLVKLGIDSDSALKTAQAVPA